MKPQSSRTRKKVSKDGIDLSETIANAEAIEVMSPQELLRQHLSEGHEVFECPQCNKYFKKKDYLQRHMETHDSVRYECDICQSVHKTYRLMQRHQLRRHYQDASALRVQCQHCDKRFRFDCHRRDHERVHTGEKPNKCAECGKCFNSRYSLRSHMLIHTGEKPFSCEQCGYACRDSSTLRKHLARHRGIGEQHPCSLCPQIFSKRDTLLAHESQDHRKEETRVECPHCKQKYRNKTSLKQHIARMHSRPRPATCPICEARVSHVANLNAHMQTHAKGRPHKCQFQGCSKAFKTKGDLSKHARIHSPEEQFECDECGRRFTRKARLAYHIQKVHQRRRRHRCNLCGDRFYGERYLTRHKERKHSPLRRRYECDLCGFRTGNKPALAGHLFAHNNKNDLSCKICKSDFRYKDYAYLKSHYLKTHQIRYRPRYKRILDAGRSFGAREAIKEEASPRDSPLAIVKEEMFDEEETVLQAISGADQISLAIKFDGPGKVEKESQHSARDLSEVIAKSLDVVEDSEKKIAKSVDDNSKELAKSLDHVDDSKRELEQERSEEIPNVGRNETRHLGRKTKVAKESPHSNSALSEVIAKLLDYVDESQKELKNLLDYVDNSEELAKSLHASVDDTEKELELESTEVIPKERSNETSDLGKTTENTKSPQKTDLAKELENSEQSEKELDLDSTETSVTEIRRTRSSAINITEKPNKRRTESTKSYKMELEERRERKERKRRQMLSEREALAGARREYNERIIAIATKMARKEKEKHLTTNTEDAEPSKNETVDGNKCDTPLQLTFKDGKAQLNMEQCYVCLKLFDSKQALVEHCATHFEVCSDSMLRKCPLCDHASARNLSRHLATAHDVRARAHTQITRDKDGKYMKPLLNSNRDDVTALEVIPSVKNLNHRKLMDIDRERKWLRRKGTVKEQLVKKGNEWVVEKKVQKIDYESYLLPLDGVDQVEGPQMGYLEKMTRLNNLAKKEGYRILFPCDACEQVCTGLAALKAHYNLHQPRPKRKRPDHALRRAKKNPNRTSCSGAELKKFFERHVGGSATDWAEFQRAYEAVDRDDEMADSDGESD